MTFDIINVNKIGYLEIDGRRFGKIFRYKNAQKDALYFNKQITMDDFKYISAHKIEKIIVDFTFFKNIDLSSFTQLETLQYLDIYGIIDASQLPSLENLKYLRIHSNTPILLHKYPNLEWISTSTPNQLVGLRSLKKIKSVTIIGGQEECSQSILDEIGMTPTLDTIEIERSKIRNLSFLKNVPDLQVLILMYNSRLASLDELAVCIESLKCLKIMNSSKISSFTTISSLKHLEYLYLDTCGKTKDIAFLSPLVELKTAIIIKTNILDGDLSNLLSLEYGVALPIMKHYHTVKNGVHAKIAIENFPYHEVGYGDRNIDLWRRIDTW